MATAKKTTKKTAKTAKKAEARTTSALRKGTLAYLGLYGIAAEQATKRAAASAMPSCSANSRAVRSMGRNLLRT